MSRGISDCCRFAVKGVNAGQLSENRKPQTLAALGFFGGRSRCRTCHLSLVRRILAIRARLPVPPKYLFATVSRLGGCWQSAIACRHCCQFCCQKTRNRSSCGPAKGLPPLAAKAVKYSLADGKAGYAIKYPCRTGIVKMHLGQHNKTNTRKTPGAYALTRLDL